MAADGLTYQEVLHEIQPYVVFLQSHGDQLVYGTGLGAHFDNIVCDLPHCGGVHLHKGADIPARLVVRRNEQTALKSGKLLQGAQVLSDVVHKGNAVLFQGRGAYYRVCREPHSVTGSEYRLRHVVTVQAPIFQPLRHVLRGKLRALAGRRQEQLVAHLRAGSSAVKRRRHKEAVLHCRRAYSRGVHPAAGLIPKPRSAADVVGVGVRQVKRSQLPAPGADMLQRPLRAGLVAHVYHAYLSRGMQVESHICGGAHIPGVLTGGHQFKHLYSLRC